MNGRPIADSWTEALRHLRSMPRSIDLVMFSTIQPIMFIVLFNYVFGGAIRTPGYDNYTQFMLPGVFAQTVLFGTAFTSIGIATDKEKGFMDRLRTLPISQVAVLVGRSISDFVRNVLTFVIMVVVALIIGFRFQGGLANALVASAMLLAFSYAFSWIQAFIGLSVNSPEAANSAGFVWMFPLTFVSSAFVPTETMPGWLATAADLNPFTVATNAARALFNGHPVGNDLWIAMGWAAGITLLFGYLSVAKFRSSSE